MSSTSEKWDRALQDADPCVQAHVLGRREVIAPDQALMAAEEGDEDAAAGRLDPDREQEHAVVAMFSQLIAFLLADGAPMRPELAQRRAMLIFRRLLPGLAIEYGVHDLIPDDCHGAAKELFPLVDFEAQVCTLPEWETILGRLMRYLYPAPAGGYEPGPEAPRRQEEWLREGTKRVYVVARTYSEQLVSWKPWLSRQGGLSRDRKREFEQWEMTWEAMAEAFGEPVGDREARNRARSRWSARAQRCIFKPIEARGTAAAVHYGKSSETRERYRAAAMGNRNRASKVPGEK